MIFLSPLDLTKTPFIPDLPSPARSPSQEEERKLSSPSRTSDQKPFRGFDITSLIRKDDDPPARVKESPPCSPNNNSSPTITKGPPIEKSSNPYSGLFGSSLYQQYLGQLLAGGQAPPFPGTTTPAPHAPPAPQFPPLHPMLLQAQLAMAAQGNSLLGGYSGVASSVLAERLKQQRFSPYSRVSPATHPASISPSGPSAFRSLTPKSSSGAASPPPVSPPSCASPSSLDLSSSPRLSSPPAKSDIRNIERMINTLNGSSEGRFGLSHHDQNK